MDEVLKIDANNKVVAGFVTDDASQLIRNARIDNATKGLKVMLVGGTGSGTVTSITANGGLTASPNPIISTGTISLDSKLSPLDTLGSALQSIRVNAGATALEYYTPSSGSGTVTSVSVTTANGVSGSVATATTTPAITLTLGAITPSTINGLTITSSTGTLAVTNGKTLSISNTLTLAGTDSTTMTFPATSATIARTDAANTFTGTQTIGALVATTVNGNTITTGSSTYTGTAGQTYTFPSTTASIARTDAAQTFTGTQTFSQTVLTANAITATSNAATVPVTSGRNIVTNNSASGLTITMTTSGAVSMQTCIVQILPSSAVAQALTFVGTENSAVTSVPANTGSSTTIPISVGFIFNAGTTKWTCVASS